MKRLIPFAALVALTLSAEMAYANWLGDLFFGDGVGQYTGPCPPQRPAILDDPSRIGDPAREAARQAYMNAMITCRTPKPPTPQQICDQGPKSGYGPECALYCRICEGASGWLNGPFTDDPDLDTGTEIANDLTAIGGYVNSALTVVNTAINTLNQMCGGPPDLPRPKDCFGGPMGEGLQCLLSVQATLNSLVNTVNSGNGSQMTERLADSLCNANSALSGCLSALGPGLSGGANMASTALGAACIVGRMGNKKIKCSAWERACHDSGWYGQPLLPERPGFGGYGGMGASCDRSDPLTDTLPNCGGNGK